MLFLYVILIFDFLLNILLASLYLFCQGKIVWLVPKEYAITPPLDSHIFQLADGSLFFWQGDTAWLLFHPLKYTEADFYLSGDARSVYLRQPKKPSIINNTPATPFGMFIGKRYSYLPKILVANTNSLWENKTAAIADFAVGAVIPQYQY